MSVTGPAANTNAISRLSELELKRGTIGEGSWHHQYKDSCYIFIGGLDTRMTEGDIIIVFSQFGDPIDINLKRDKNTGKSLGYCFLGYRDQRSTILAVDNFNGSTLLGRRIRVDHVMDYKAPVSYEDELDEEGNKIPKEYKPTGAEGSGIDKYYVTKSEMMLRETARTKRSPQASVEMDEDERWALEFEEMLQKNKESDDGSYRDQDHKPKYRHSRGGVSHERRRHEDRDSRRDKHDDKKRHRKHRHSSKSRSRSKSRDRDRRKRERLRSRSSSEERYHRHRKSSRHRRESR
ncbi:RNA-binding motif protein, X-linked 2 [Theileria orientalis]|uniref:RNA-binding motif protein, X-linked 2 n=1 Tax=Theileria orientalis TaxID=68886 RepID=A0A976SKA0_THEOR|nr:RNA-binding motif protein, X-linked 2 [Theileria orientalis]